MKTFILSLIISISTFNVTLATVTPESIVTPESELSIINTSEVELNVVNVLQKDFFKTAEYNLELEALEFVTADYVNFLQIFDETGKLLYQLPVMSNKLKVSKKLFSQGNYKIGFITKNNTTVQFTNLKVN